MSIRQEPGGRGDIASGGGRTEVGVAVKVETTRLAENTLDIAVRCSHVTVALGNAIVIDDFSNSWTGGTIVRVFGRNGSGKSTLLGTATGHVRPQRGTVEWTVSGQPARPSDAVFYLPQYPLVFRSMSVAANLTLMARVSSQRLDDALAGLWRDDLLAGMFRLLGSFGQRAGNLSTGQQRAAQILALAASERPVLVLDEPETGLADELRKEVVDLLERRARSGALVVVAEPREFIRQNNEGKDEVPHNE